MEKSICRRTRPFDRSSRVLLSTTPQKYTFDRRRKDFSGRTARLASQDQLTVSHRRSVVSERHTATSRRKKQRIYICCEISTLVPFVSIACLQLAFPHIKTVKYIYRARCQPLFIIHMYNLTVFIIKFNIYKVWHLLIGTWHTHN